jgi:hypothetical protein
MHAEYDYHTKNVIFTRRVWIWYERAEWLEEQDNESRQEVEKIWAVMHGDAWWTLTSMNATVKNFESIALH